MALTQKEIILNLLKDKGEWTPSYDLIKVDTKYGWLGSGADRIARYLVEDGEIERKQIGKYAYYRLKLKETLFNVPDLRVVLDKDLIKYL